MEIRTVGIDLGKSVFHLVGLDQRGNIVAKRHFSRPQLLAYTANLPPCLVGMEACCGAHFLGTLLVKQSHQVRLMPAQFVKPFVKSNKNDYLDAEAIAEAVQRPTMRFVPIKSTAQLDLQALHRVRDRLISRRTGVINQLRALLLERGMIFRKGRRYLRRQMPSSWKMPNKTYPPRCDGFWNKCGKSGRTWKNRSGDSVKRSNRLLAMTMHVNACSPYQASVR
jgi:transposase